ncbi:hypothetical protein RvY_13231-1 [Ramazzottius varieornatus]|uniref:Pre-mRNA polyadenylation factor Fip1 domain-containing protein n=1 Tax=Ramazzottius varieornatus TaxID=947166 RepID=A0A1D1VM59_RAMVA|nr:hypothetical protein RvY_13231-1 [Ramazzottius varieornatus]
MSARVDLRKGGIDFNDVPEINGVPVTEFNIDTLEDKPWKKPGADLSDYFNYGFNEDTWRMYCDKQRNMRSEAHRLEHAHNQISTVSKNDNSKYGGPGGPGDEAPFRAQFRRRPNQDGGMMNQAGRERMLNPMMMRPGIMMMPGGMHGPGMMHPMGAPMNPMMMRPMGPMSLHAVPPPMRQQDQHSQQRRDQHGPDMGFRRNLATLTRIDTSGSQGDGSTS